MLLKLLYSKHCFKPERFRGNSTISDLPNISLLWYTFSATATPSRLLRKMLWQALQPKEICSLLATEVMPAFPPTSADNLTHFIDFANQFLIPYRSELSLVHLSVRDFSDFRRLKKGTKGLFAARTNTAFKIFNEKHGQTHSMSPLEHYLW